ncbi:unnamed protein product [Rotaria sordida]|uniref:Beta-lactamase-related domain-containing protein n=1 Tax=Rotaria sordida TaxID=392033 RepID=A0A815DN54_9BILA|nr:unnamed protein product [Rotaria sordida]CAF4027925.1 unnamed protein product [Rotaria sordida]
MQIFWLFIIITLIKAEDHQFKYPPTKPSIQPFLDDAYIPGAAIMVVKPNEVIYEEGIGYHSPPISEPRQTIDPLTSIFVLGSISKTFIVVAAMQMVELNRLNLDTDINEYLPSLMKIFHPQYPNISITTRHLLTHTSGIGTNFEEELTHYLPGDSFTQTNLGNVIQKYLSNEKSWLPIPPGNKTFYSNMGACLAAFIVERVVGVSFEHYVQDKILKPLDIDEKKGGYRLSHFQDNKKNLVDHYIFNTS